jgi:hypothetical protein
MSAGRVVHRPAVCSDYGPAKVSSGHNETTVEEAREHRLDRMVSAATYRRERARVGRGFRFELPPSLREKS